MFEVRIPSVYVDTNILTYLHYHSGNLVTLARAMLTRDWWDHERRSFHVYSSSFTLSELTAGDYDNQADAIAAVKRLTFVPVTAEAQACAAMLVSEHVVPKEKDGDALQLALGTVHRLDYLLSWNHAHLVKWEVQERLIVLSQRLGYRAPLLVTPESIPQVRLGQEIRRRDGRP